MSLITSEIKSNILITVAALLLLTCARLGYLNFSLSNELDAAKVSISKHEANAAKFEAGIEVQNNAVAALKRESADRLEKSEKAMADVKPIVEQEERRISGIRNDPKAQSYEEIHQKLLKDALL